LQAKENPDRIALVAGDKAWSYADLDREVNSGARRLASLGVGSGDRVCTRLQNGPLAAALPHAVMRLGAQLVPLNTRLTHDEIQWQVNDVSPRLIIDDSFDFGRVSEKSVDLKSEYDLDETLAIIYTSGTTGTPKGAMLSIGNFWWSALGSAFNLENRDDDKWLACMPLFHVGGLSIVMRSAIYGITAVVHDGFDAGRVNASIDHEGITIVSLVAVMLERLLDERQGRPFPDSLRCILLGGGPASPELLARCTASGAPVVQTYGLTEACSQVATVPLAEAGKRAGSAGKVLHPNEIDISSDGEILVRGPIVMKGYYNNPEATSRSIVDGWLHTGDAGRIDADGYLYVLDRRSDLIVTGGENVYPAEVEAVLTAHPGVIDAAVIGVADPTWGQRVVAVVRVSDETNADALTDHCRGRLAGFKRPSEFQFVHEALPRTASGKLRRAEIREKFSAR
jgi:O-succinylbenzoic acid--CoA ligase